MFSFGRTAPLSQLQTLPNFSPRQLKGQLSLLIWPLCLPPSSTSCSLPAGDFVRGNHRPTGRAGFPPAGLSAVLSDQSEEEGQEGRRPGEARPERRQGERRRSLQTGRERRRRRP